MNKDFERPPADLITDLYQVSSATATGTLSGLGIRDAYLQGPIARTPGTKVVGPAITLQFLPKREDQTTGLGAGQTEQRSALWAVLEHVQPGDVMVVDARGQMRTGCFGEMLLTYFQAQGGKGVIVDGCIRDYPQVRDFETPLPLWTRGFTPNSAGQVNMWPWDFNVPIGCGGVLVIPGDIIIADDDGAVVVPIKLAPELVKRATEHEEWEVFSRMRLQQGGALKTYYPLSEEGRREYEEWRDSQEGNG